MAMVWKNDQGLTIKGHKVLYLGEMRVGKVTQSPMSGAEYFQFSTYLPSAASSSVVYETEAAAQAALEFSVNSWLKKANLVMAS